MKFSYPEGATPLDDASGLKIKWVKTQRDLNDVEAENIAHATTKYLLRSVPEAKKWFNVSFLQRMHKEMFNEVWDWAGKFRTTQTHPGIRPFQIPVALAHLCDDVQFWCTQESKLSSIEKAAKIHHQLVYIHPFSNGNGRFSRLVADRYLKSLNHLNPSWPIDLDKDGPLRKHYIQALREADKGSYESLIDFMMKFILE